MTEVWLNHRGNDLLQGDLLRACQVPLVAADFGEREADGEIEVTVEVRDLIVITQSCDLANAKTPLVALCPISRLERFEHTSPDFKRKGVWELVRKGRVEGLHLLASPVTPQINREASVVDFRQIFSLPTAYLCRHAELLGDRWRLQSPFVEHFSQAFARFFMRVGLPVSIPEFK
ncbi:MAG TPA: hypothetical protein VND64_23615 [Pirellulales bacterium]|nr:hypothetical protein [Pirellulales bacterium]